MARLHQQPICVASSLLVPLVTLATPGWVLMASHRPGL